MKKYDVVIRGGEIAENDEKTTRVTSRETNGETIWGEVCVVNHAERRFDLHPIESIDRLREVLERNRFRIDTVVVMEGNVNGSDLVPSSSSSQNPYARMKLVEIPAAFYPSRTTSLEEALRAYLETMELSLDTYVETVTDPLRFSKGGSEEEDEETTTMSIETLEYILPDRENATFYETDEGAALFAECLRNGRMWTPPSSVVVAEISTTDFPKNCRWRWACERKAPPIVLDRTEAIQKYVHDFIKIYDDVKTWYETTLGDDGDSETKAKNDEIDARFKSETTTMKRSHKPTVERLLHIGKMCEAIEKVKRRWDWRLIGWFDLMNRQRTDSRMIHGERGTGWVLRRLHAPLRNSLLIDGIESQTNPVVHLTGDNDTGKTTTTRVACLFALVCETLGMKIPAERFVYPSAAAARGVRFHNNGVTTIVNVDGGNEPVLRVCDDVFELNAPIERVTHGFVVLHNWGEEMKHAVEMWKSNRTETCVTFTKID